MWYCVIWFLGTLIFYHILSTSNHPVKLNYQQSSHITREKTDRKRGQVDFFDYQTNHLILPFYVNFICTEFVCSFQLFVLFLVSFRCNFPFIVMSYTTTWLTNELTNAWRDELFRSTLSFPLNVLNVGSASGLHTSRLLALLTECSAGLGSAKKPAISAHCGSLAQQIASLICWYTTQYFPSKMFAIQVWP